MKYGDWYVYCEGKNPVRVFGGESAKKDAIAHLIKYGPNTSQTERNKIAAYLNNEQVLGSAVLVVGMVRKPGQPSGTRDAWVMRVIGPPDTSGPVTEPPTEE